MTGKCSICVSKHREWIEEQHEAGKPLRDISKEMEEQFGESISYVAIGNHVNKHMGGESDRTAVLEQRIRNLELWMATAIPDITSVTWHEHNAGGDETYSLSSGALYRSSIPNPKGLESEMAAISAALVSKHKAETAQRKEEQRLEAVKRNEAIAAEKQEREEQAKRAKDKEEKERIHKMREEVAEFDRNAK